MKNNYFIFILLFALLRLLPMNGQTISVASGTNFSIKAGTIFFVDSLTLIPSVNFSLNGNRIIKKSSLTNTSANSTIAQVYLFNNVTNPYSGTVKFKYADGASLNGISEQTLSLNNFDGSIWKSYMPASRDEVTNILSTDLNSANLKELTLGAFFNPLSVRWQSFTAVKQLRSIILQWSISNAQNTQLFSIEHSTDNVNWQKIHQQNFISAGILPTAFSYVHNNPLQGNNFYRIAENDFNGKKSYSEIKLVNFNNLLSGFTILTNPVNQHLLKVQVNTASVLSLYSNDGKLLFKNKYASGIQEIDVSHYAKGFYFLSSSNNITTILIQ